MRTTLVWVGIHSIPTMLLSQVAMPHVKEGPHAKDGKCNQAGHNPTLSGPEKPKIL